MPSGEALNPSQRESGERAGPRWREEEGVSRSKVWGPSRGVALWGASGGSCHMSGLGPDKAGAHKRGPGLLNCRRSPCSGFCSQGCPLCGEKCFPARSYVALRFTYNSSYFCYRQ